jgi:DNA-binding transcriptional regulator GbsR (MarR family)
MKEARLLSAGARDIERKIVEFYKTVGEMVHLNPRTTEIFAYLRMYDVLSQEQLRELTGFSLSTISSTLQSFLQTDVVSRSMIPGTHKNLYILNRGRVKFDYTPPTGIMEDLEALDLYIVERQAELREQQSMYSTEMEFLHRRLNSLRNYIEVQRRQISREQRHAFFEEDVSDLIPRNEMVVYPFDTRELEEDLVGFLGHLKNDPMRARMVSIFITRRSLNQQALMDFSGFSRSAVSRLLRREMKTGYIRVLPREYRRPQVYYLDSVSLSTLSLILKADDFIFSYAPRLQEILSTLQSEKRQDRGDTSLLMTRIEDILGQIETFRRRTRSIRQAHQELLRFLDKGAPV